LLFGNDGHLAGEPVCFTNRENLVVLASSANRDVPFQHDEHRQIWVTGFIKNFTVLCRSKLGDGPNAVYLLRTKLGWSRVVPAAVPRMYAKETYKF
jgi:hypothetical protein